MLDAAHPAPETPARAITDNDELPRNAKALLRKADTLGLDAQATYARGTDLDGVTVVDSVVVRLAGHGFFAAASWHRRPEKRYAYETGYAWRAKGARVRVNYRGLVAIIDALVDGGDDA